MAFVYIVTDGDFDDYKIVGVYANREIAEHVKENTCSDNIEEHEVQENEGLLKLGPVYSLYIHLDTGYVRSLADYSDIREEGKTIVRPSLHAKDGRVTQLFVLSTQSREHAIELAHKKRLEWMNADKSLTFAESR